MAIASHMSSSSSWRIDESEVVVVVVSGIDVAVGPGVGIAKTG